MRYILLFLLFSFNLSAQYTVTCEKCGSEEEQLTRGSFTGLKIQKGTRPAVYLSQPVKARSKGGSIYLLDAHGVKFEAKYNEFTTLTTAAAWRAFLAECVCVGSGSGGGDVDLSDYVTYSNPDEVDTIIRTGFVIGDSEGLADGNYMELASDFYFKNYASPGYSVAIATDMNIYVSGDGSTAVYGREGMSMYYGSSSERVDISQGQIHITRSEGFSASDSDVLIKSEIDDLIAAGGGGGASSEAVRVNTLMRRDSFAANIPTNRDYHMIPRLCLNPVNGVLTQIYRAGTGHVGTGDFGVTILRRSLDRGKTWHGINPAESYTVISSEANIDHRSQGAFYTNTGRLIVMYGRYTGTAWTGMDTRYIYSDNDGVTWSSPVILPGSATTTVGITPALPYANKCVYNSSGTIIYPLYEYVTSTSSRIKLVGSSDNGVTWSEYSIPFSDGTMLASEAVIEDFGDGLFLMIVRRTTDPTGNFYPFILRSNDYGLNWAGVSETMNISDVNSGLHGSINLALEGPATPLGDATRNCLPDITKMVYKGSQYIVMPYHVRSAASLFNTLRLNVLSLDDYLSSGAAELEDIATTLFVGTNNGASNPNGGNTSIVTYGNEMIIPTGDQTTSSSSGPQRIMTLYVRAQTVATLIDDYLNLK